MKTSKPFSTISYNSVEFLQTKLNDLVNRRKIAFYAFIEHLPEEDERKKHKHVLIVPNGQINTDQVYDFLLEIDPTYPDKPLGCTPFRSSKFSDWYLYAIHDRDYLASKGQSRKYFYKNEDFIVSDSDFFNEEIHTIDYSSLSRFKKLRDAVSSGVSFEQMVMNGQIPIPQLYAYRQAYELIRDYDSRTNRNNKTSHQAVDPETGEIYE